MTAPQEKERDFTYQLHGGQHQVPGAPLREGPGVLPRSPLPLGLTLRDRNPRSCMEGEQRSGERGGRGRLPLSLKASGVPAPTDGGDWLEMGRDRGLTWAGRSNSRNKTLGYSSDLLPKSNRKKLCP